MTQGAGMEVGAALVAATANGRRHAAHLATALPGARLADKRTDPPVVTVDDAGRFAVALVGGHHGGNDLARRVA
ncbi:MAG TPA: hypothetical protein VG452_03960, partial [Egibacteraceae bacterium]|nr:hypothetical protein [Egibacteraceae bacterium]